MLVVIFVVTIAIAFMIGDYSIIMYIGLFFIATAVPILIIMWILWRFLKRYIPKKTETENEIEGNLQKNNETLHGFIFGKSNNDKIETKSEDTDGHILVVGGSGSGKSSCIAIPSLLSWNDRVFVIDIKGELYEHTKNSTKRNNIKVFNPLQDNAWGYDPFYLLEYAINKNQEAEAMAYALIPMNPEIKDPFWINNARDMLTGAILHFHNEGDNFINTVTKILTPNSIDDFIKELANSTADTVKFYVKRFIELKAETVAGIYTELCQHIRLYVTDLDLKKSLSKSNCINPTALKSADIYIIIPEHQLEQWKNLLILITSQFLRYFEKRNESENLIPILFLLDEFPRLGKIEKIDGALATLRSKKITIALLMQSLSQLDFIYGETLKEVICGNCLYTAILKVTDYKSQEYLSKRIGTHEKAKISKIVNTEAYINIKTGRGTTESTEEKARIKPEDLGTLKDVILLHPNGRTRLKKVHYSELEEYNNRGNFS